jgi:XTP/dITP diphosphohydrolase
MLLATRNQGKVREFEHLLASLDGLRVLTLSDVGETSQVVEDGDTFEANASKKATEIARATGLLVLSDDSGLEVDALGGRPGVHSARYAGDSASDADNNQKLIAELQRLAVPHERRTARYRVVLALAQPEGAQARVVHIEHAACEGRIRLVPSGDQGFGYDPYFEPDGFTCSMAELSLEQKNKISHRAKVSAQMCRFLVDYLAAGR